MTLRYQTPRPIRRLGLALRRHRGRSFDRQEEKHCSIWLNCLDSFDALRIKDVYAPKRKQGESKLQLHHKNASYSRRVLPSPTATATPTPRTAPTLRSYPTPPTSAVAPTDEKQTHSSTPTSGRDHAKNFRVRIVESCRSNLVSTGLCSCDLRPRRYHHRHQHQ
jgi:hypothetical protein